MTNKPLGYLAIVATAGLLWGTSATQAALISVDFGNNWGGSDSPLYSGAAVLGATDDQWNKVTTDVIDMPLTTSSGDSSTVELTTSGVWGYSNQGGANALLQDYAYGLSMTFTLSGLAPDSSYHLVAYSVGGTSGEGGTFTGALSGTSDGTNRSTYVLGENYQETLDVLSNGSGVLTFTITQGPIGDHLAVLNGFQISDNAPTIPEPASLGILVLGGAALLARRRRH